MTFHSTLVRVYTSNFFLWGCLLVHWSICNFWFCLEDGHVCFTHVYSLSIDQQKQKNCNVSCAVYLQIRWVNLNVAAFSETIRHRWNLSPDLNIGFHQKALAAWFLRDKSTGLWISRNPSNLNWWTPDKLLPTSTGFCRNSEPSTGFNEPTQGGWFFLGNPRDLEHVRVPIRFQLGAGNRWGFRDEDDFPYLPRKLGHCTLDG